MGAPKSASIVHSPTSIQLTDLAPSSAHYHTFPPTPTSASMKGSLTKSTSNNSKNPSSSTSGDRILTATIVSSSEADLVVLVQSPSAANAPTGSKGSSSSTASIPWKSIVEELIKQPEVVDSVLLHLASVPGGKERAFKILGAGSTAPARKYSDVSGSGEIMLSHTGNAGPGHGQNIQIFTPPEPAGHRWDHGYNNVSTASSCHS